MLHAALALRGLSIWWDLLWWNRWVSKTKVIKCSLSTAWSWGSVCLCDLFSARSPQSDGAEPCFSEGIYKIQRRLNIALPDLARLLKDVNVCSVLCSIQECLKRDQSNSSRNHNNRPVVLSSADRSQVRHETRNSKTLVIELFYLTNNQSLSFGLRIIGISVLVQMLKIR